ncbi:unnamed protein product, partial [Mesorhabditis belari]|uniref:Serine/threonine specific protein phosphatases domain-containing protein n=1 Tax=Mesorhabditis belari TaxID=2138241 RepID=A0AAF3ELG2_9BILA
MLILAYKTFYPNDLYLLRGNHQGARVNKHYGFYEDCLKLGAKGEYVWALFQKVFNLMPICALVGTKILCMPLPEMETLDKIREIKKPLCNPFHGVSLSSYLSSGMEAIEIGSGIMFGLKPSIICARIGTSISSRRAHQVCYDGFSTYCNSFVNAGAILHVSTELECQIIALMPDVKNATERVQNGKL